MKYLQLYDTKSIVILICILKRYIFSLSYSFVHSISPFPFPYLTLFASLSSSSVAWHIHSVLIICSVFIKQWILFVFRLVCSYALNGNGTIRKSSALKITLREWIYWRNERNNMYNFRMWHFQTDFSQCQPLLCPCPCSLGLTRVQDKWKYNVQHATKLAIEILQALCGIHTVDGVTKNEKHHRNKKATAKHVDSIRIECWRVACIHSLIRATDEHVMFKEQYMCTQLCALNIFSHLYVLQHFNMDVPWSDEMHDPNTQCYNTCKIYVHFLFETMEKKSKNSYVSFFPHFFSLALYICILPLNQDFIVTAKKMSVFACSLSSLRKVTRSTLWYFHWWMLQNISVACVLLHYYRNNFIKFFSSILGMSKSN